MYDAACPSEPQPLSCETPQPLALQRAVGELAVSVRRRDDASVLEGLRQAGCLKARFPRAVVPGWIDVVTLNTSGGIAGGDRLDSAFDVRSGARASIAAQAAERFYRALPGGAASQVRTRIAVEAGAAAEWLPQETILFDRCALYRRLEVDLAEDAWFLGVESLVFGRAAMGETVEQASLRDLIRVRRGDRLLWHDAVRLEGNVAATLRRKAIADGARAVATIVHVAPQAEATLDTVRSALHAHLARIAGEVDAQSASGEGHAPTRSHNVTKAAASAWNGMLIARILAPTSATLRTTVIAVLSALRDHRPLPRVWMC
jgi:urease accessory protein